MRGDSPHLPPATTNAPASLARWRSLTYKANVAFAHADYAAARPIYEHALRVAERLLAAPEFLLAPDDCLAALVVAHHNLADLHRQAGESPAAVAHLCLPHETLLDVANANANASGASAGTRLCALRHLGKTRLALLHWQKHHGSCARIDALLMRGTAPSRLPPGSARIH